ncbi:MAG: translation initiation factor [Polyangiales bacterium]
MAKKQRSDSIPTGEPGKLTHSPFAQLGGGATPTTPTPAPVATPAAVPVAAHSGRLVLQRQTKHRGGKPVVVIRGFAELAHWDGAAVEAFAKELKQSLGCGGTVEHGREIVLQGDRPAQVAELLRARGFRVDGVTS